MIYDKSVADRIAKRPFTPTQNMIVRALVENGGRMSYEDMINFLYPNPDRAPQNEMRLVWVHVFKLRKQLREPAAIKTIHQYGFELTGVEGVKFRETLPIVREPTKSERILLNALMDGRLHSMSFLHSELRRWRSTSDREIVRVFLSRLRGKLKPGWEIENVRGRGWKLIEIK